MHQLEVALDESVDQMRCSVTTWAGDPSDIEPCWFNTCFKEKFNLAASRLVILKPTVKAQRKDDESVLGLCALMTFRSDEASFCFS